MKKQQSFCQICRHDSPGHEKNCPVLTGEPQTGSDLPAEFWQQIPQGPQNQLMQVGEGTLAQLRARKL
jgi:hypothetical protein